METGRILRTVGLLLFVIVVGTCKSVVEASESRLLWLEKDFAELTALYSGHWDNDRHVFFAEDSGIDLGTVPPRMLVENSAVKEDKANTYLSFDVDVRGVAIESPVRKETFLIVPKEEVIRQKFSTVEETGKSKQIDCIVDWRREGKQFRGDAKGSECFKLYPAPKSRKKLKQTWILSAKELWIKSERGNSRKDSRLRRVRPFECWVSVLRGAKHGDTGLGQNDWDFRRGVNLHDQGGEAIIMTDETPPRKVRLVLRDVEWPYGTNRPSLVLYVMEGDSERATSYAWGTAGAERIGINLRWIQASCTHKPS